MKRDIVTTGRYGIGIQVYTVHVGRDTAELTRFYEDVFGALLYLGADEPGPDDAARRVPADHGPRGHPGRPYCFTVEDLPGDPFAP